MATKPDEEDMRKEGARHCRTLLRTWRKQDKPQRLPDDAASKNMGEMNSLTIVLCTLEGALAELKTMVERIIPRSARSCMNGNVQDEKARNAQADCLYPSGGWEGAKMTLFESPPFTCRALNEAFTCR